jgi:ubiquinone/menaquinone biosynthesis C-methylase UbiE
MPPGRFEQAVRAWLAEGHGEGHPLTGFWVQDHMERVALAARFHLPLIREQRDPAGARVLDLGCGTAGTGVALALALASVVAADMSERVLHLAGIRAADAGVRLARVQADARGLPFRDAAFEICVCDQVIEHVEGYPTLLAEAYRVLGPGGLLLVSAPHRLALREGHTALLFASWLPHRLAARYAVWRGRRMPDEPWDIRLELPWTIRRRLREAGFEEIRSPWKQPRRPPTEGSRVRRLLANVGLLVRVVRWGFRWHGFLFGTVTFVLRKPGAPEGRS